MNNSSFNKNKILAILKDVLEPSQILNINNFSNEVLIDVIPTNPTHKAKLDLQKKIIEVLKEKYNSQFRYKIDFKPIPKKIESIDTKQNLPSIKNIITISSAKGGVGKSTITSNIAVTLKEMGFKVGILDADIYGPSMHIMFDLVGKKPLAVDVQGESKMNPIESFGIKILSIGFFTKMDQAVIWRGPMATKALNQLIFDSNWGELDFLLIDLDIINDDVIASLSLTKSLAKKPKLSRYPLILDLSTTPTTQIIIQEKKARSFIPVSNIFIMTFFKWFFYNCFAFFLNKI